MNHCYWGNHAPVDRRNAKSTLLQDAFSRIVQSADTNWAADSASLEYHLKCKNAYLLHRKLQSYEKKLPAVENSTEKKTSNAPVLTIQDIIPESRLAKYGNFTYRAEDALFKKSNQSENGNDTNGSELQATSSETSLVLEPWQDVRVSEIFQRMALKVIHPISPKRTTESKDGNSSGEDCWPTSDRDSCKLCQNPSDIFTDNFGKSRVDDNMQCSVWPYISEEEVLLAPNPATEFGCKGNYKKLAECLASPYIRRLWPANQKSANVTKMQRGKDQWSFSDEESDLDDDNAPSKYYGFSNPCFERLILAKGKEILHLIDEDAVSCVTSKWQPLSCSSRREQPYWEYVNPERICNQQVSSRIQTYAEVCRAKARTSNSRSFNVCKKSKSQSSLSVGPGSWQIKSTYSHESLAHMTPLAHAPTTPVQHPDPWPALAASTPIKSRREDLPERHSSAPGPFLTTLSKKKKKTATRNDPNYNMLCSNLFASSPHQSQGSPLTFLPTAVARPRPITGYRNRDCSEGQKSPASDAYHYQATDETSQKPPIPGMEGGSFDYGTALQVRHNPRCAPGPMSTRYKKYHWHAPPSANKHVVTWSADGRTFDYGATHQENHTTAPVPQRALDFGSTASKKHQNNQWPASELLGQRSKTSGNGAGSGATVQENHQQQCKKAGSENCSADRFALQIEHPQHQRAIALLSTTQGPQDQENSFADERQHQLEENSQYPYIWFSGQLYGPWNYQNIASSAQYQFDSFMTSGPVVQVFEMKPFYGEKAIQNIMSNSIPLTFPFPPITSTFSSHQWAKFGGGLQSSCPTNVSQACSQVTIKGNSDNRGADDQYSMTGAGITVNTNKIKNALCLASMPQHAPKLHQRKPRNLRNLIHVIGVQVQESVLALPPNSPKDSPKKALENVAGLGNVTELPSGSVPDQGETKPSLLSEGNITDANSKKLLRGLGILNTEEGPPTSGGGV